MDPLKLRLMGAVQDGARAAADAFVEAFAAGRYGAAARLLPPQFTWFNTAMAPGEWCSQMARAHQGARMPHAFLGALTAAPGQDAWVDQAARVLGTASADSVFLYDITKGARTVSLAVVAGMAGTRDYRVLHVLDPAPLKNLLPQT